MKNPSTHLAKIQHCSPGILFKLITAFTLGLCQSSCDESALNLSTKEINLEYSPEADPMSAFFLEMSLGSLGLIDITKLEPVEDIKSLKIRYADIPSDNYKAQIVIIDANRNGKFEYDSLDLIGLTSFSGKLKLENVNFTLANQPVAAKIGDETYTIQFDEEGENIHLTRTKLTAGEADLAFPFRLPDLKVRALTKGAELNKMNDKYTYVEFWGTWCKPCLEIIPEIKSLKADFEDRLNIVSVDCHDEDMKRVKEFIVKYQMNWDHLVADELLLKEFATSYFPCGVLFDADGNLMEYGISPKEVAEVLTKAK